MHIDIHNDAEHGPCIHAITLRDLCKNGRHPNSWVGEKAERLGLRQDVDYWGAGKALYVSLSAALRLAAASNTGEGDSPVAAVRDAIHRVILSALADSEVLRENLQVLQRHMLAEHEKAKADDLLRNMKNIDSRAHTREDRIALSPIKEQRMMDMEQDRAELLEAVSSVWQQSNLLIGRMTAAYFAIEAFAPDAMEPADDR